VLLYDCLVLKKIKIQKGEIKMKISKILKKVIKSEGNKSPTSRKIAKLQSSKEFSYLVDTKTA